MRSSGEAVERGGDISGSKNDGVGESGDTIRSARFGNVDGKCSGKKNLNA